MLLTSNRAACCHHWLMFMKTGADVCHESRFLSWKFCHQLIIYFDTSICHSFMQENQEYGDSQLHWTKALMIRLNSVSVLQSWISFSFCKAFLYTVVFMASPKRILREQFRNQDPPNPCSKVAQHKRIQTLVSSIRPFSSWPPSQPSYAFHPHHGLLISMLLGRMTHAVPDNGSSVRPFAFWQLSSPSYDFIPHHC